MSENQIPPTINQTPPAIADLSQARMWNMFCHLSALAGCILPFGNFLGPILVWQMKKDEFPSVIIHGKAALNFQITLFILTLILGLLAAVMLVLTLGLAIFLFIPVIVILAVVSLVFPILAAVKANNGEDYKYPFSLELVK
jgi:uncharacterized Tic20 family protein